MAKAIAIMKPSRRDLGPERIAAQRNSAIVRQITSSIASNEPMVRPPASEVVLLPNARETPVPAFVEKLAGSRKD
jgi:hypothetical protein